ncbi:PIN domain-containing protein [Dasania sp. GY-MA-18]|uniref:PIN domain-containing protein n=1 Tax=Dasania phycosphaerae TaxID=2950436 RepID=A0A9J6RPF8_9GAMM|nr:MULTISPECIES: PIN domain-containing protein [Dasania]MCR8923792.1 PIN domain-containing protein [Dasania sp. GY-MA-18]MCZ0866226.1 PIN domain-containing protein [Dasania phycosphaerae]MCZ0869950.1 PIN domain-containing protein [Dasania phycosphaerae]
MLETRKVFIDTQYFVKAGLHFDNPALKSFRKYCESNELFHVSTSVVKREVEAKIAVSVKEAIGAIKTFRRKARLLSSLEDDQIQGLFAEVPEKDIYQKSSQVFEDYMNGCSTEIVEASEVDPEDILSLYFETKPPFGEGKKKSEFPDAFSLLSIKSYLDEGEKIYVISDDGDLKEFCESEPQLISVETLDKLLDIYTQHTNTRSDQVRQYFTVNEMSIKDKIKEYLEDCEVYNSSTWEDAEVDDGLTVKQLGEIIPSVIYIDDEESQITFDIDIEFEVTVIGPDFINGIYDKEEGRMFTFDSTSRTSTISKTFTVEMFLSYEFKDGKLENAEDLDLHVAGVSGGIEVAVEEDGEEWY